jgi:hypothetical protein
MSYSIKSKDHHINTGWGLGDLLMEKTALVFGEQAPELVNSEHAGIPYNTRKRAYKNYAQVKAQEPKTGWGTALGTGVVIGGIMGGLGSGGAAGALGGAAVGGLLGAVMKSSDDVEIDEARHAVRNRNSKHVADDVMAHRMARHARMEREQGRSEARANARMVAGAVRSRPTRVNNYRTQINQVNVSNRTTNIRNSRTTLNRF